MTRQEIMSDHIDRLEAVLHRMETERKAAKEQLEMYMHTIDKNIEMYDKRADANDKRFAALRGTLIGIVVFVLGVSFTGSVAINSSLDKKLEEDDIREMDYVPTSSVLRGDYSVIEGVLEVIEYSTGLNKEDSDDYEVLMKRKAYQEVSGEITRGN